MTARDWHAFALAAWANDKGGFLAMMMVFGAVGLAMGVL